MSGLVSGRRELSGVGPAAHRVDADAQQICGFPESIERHVRQHRRFCLPHLLQWLLNVSGPALLARLFVTECARAGAVMTTATVGGRGAGRAQATRASLLAAARGVFSESGFAEANIADVVSRAGASVGSLYHHFGGKADLYLALFEDYQSRQEERAASAVRGARGEGERDPFGLFLVGAGAYLRGCWEERELARMFLDGGGPPGFELIARRRYRDWILVNAALLRADDQPLGETLVLVLTTVVAEAGREVAVQDTYDDGMRLGDEGAELLGRIGRRYPPPLDLPVSPRRARARAATPCVTS